MRPLRYSINVTLDNCRVDHQVGIPDEESHRFGAASLERADALLFGRVTYEMMEAAWRQPATREHGRSCMDDADIAFAQKIDGAKKYVVSSTWTRSIETPSSSGNLGKAAASKLEGAEGLASRAASLLPLSPQLNSPYFDELLRTLQEVPSSVPCSTHSRRVDGGPGPGNNEHELKISRAAGACFSRSSWSRRPPRERRPRCIASTT